jgi:hypothetical protein
MLLNITLNYSLEISWLKGRYFIYYLHDTIHRLRGYDYDFRNHSHLSIDNFKTSLLLLTMIFFF